MNQSQCLKSIIKILNLPACRNIAATLLEYLGIEQIIAISQASHNSNQHHYFFHLVKNTRFIQQYINKTDRSIYFTFYGEQQYKQIENSQIAALTKEQSTIFQNYHQAFRHIANTMQQTVPLAQDEIDILNNLLVDPDLPLPKLKRETQGMYCSSPFQLFLVDCTFKEEEDDDFSCFQNFRQFLNMDKEEQYLKQFISIVKEKHTMGAQLRKIMKVRYTPYEISYKNYNDFIIENNQLHNFIVGLFAMTDVMIQATHTFISLIHDPLQRLVQLLLRYSIFRNYVLAVQEYLSFAFKMYENIYHDSIEQDPKKPQFKFWRPALTKWFLKMNYLHSQGAEVYMHCLVKLRNKKICENLTEMCSTDQLKYGKILNCMQMNNFQYILGSKIFNGAYNTSSQIGIYFDSHPQNYQIVVMEFNEYLIDISVNQKTVHWCGHSDHQVEEPYLLFQDKLIALNKEYYQSFISHDIQLNHQILKLDVEYLSMLQVKNRTLKKVVALINEGNQFGVEELTFDFDEADHKLQYFNNKAFILAQVDTNERPFYSIPPLCSAQKLIDMLDTNDSSNNNTDSEYYEYHSQQQGLGTQASQISRKKDFKEDQSEQIQVDSKQIHKKTLIPVKKIFAEDYDEPQSPMKAKLNEHL